MRCEWCDIPGVWNGTYDEKIKAIFVVDWCPHCGGSGWAFEIGGSG